MSQPRCTGTTKRGVACRSFALPNRSTCIMHAEDLKATVHAARQRGGTAAAKIRLLEGRRLKLESAGALSKFMSDLIVDTLAGSVDPTVARTCIYGVATLRQVLETSQLEERLSQLEAQLATAGNQKRGRQW